MTRINTARDATQVVKNKSVRNFSNKKSVSEAVSLNHLHAVAEFSVPIGSGAFPNPTGVSLPHFTPESVTQPDSAVSNAAGHGAEFSTPDPRRMSIEINAAVDAGNSNHVSIVTLGTQRVKGESGYVMIDNRASGGELIEMATATCCHCNRVWALNPNRSRPRGYCAKCHAYVCDLAGCNTECNPMPQMVELAQKHPGEPFLLRGPNGLPLFNPVLKENTKVY